MKNNYDLILNFEINDGEPISDKQIENILIQGKFIAKYIEVVNSVTVQKVVISQAVDSRRPS